MRRLTRAATAAALAVGLLAGATACSGRAELDEIILYYKSGAGDNRTFQECIEPGTSGSYAVDDDTFSLPTNARTWNVQPDGQGDSKDPFVSGSKPTDRLDTKGKVVGSQPGPAVHVWASLDFWLNTDCKAGASSPVARFWENVGRRYEVSAIDGSGEFSAENFRKMLLNMLVPVERDVLQTGTRDYTADELDADLNGAWTAIERRIGPLFNARVREKAGGDYFCGVGFRQGEEVTWQEDVLDPVTGKVTGQQEKKGTCPPVRVDITTIDLADPAIQAARNAVFAAQQKAQADLIEARAKLEKANILAQANRNSAYLEFEKLENELEKAKLELEAAKACASNPNCTVIVGVGAAVTVPAK